MLHNASDFTGASAASSIWQTTASGQASHLPTSEPGAAFQRPLVAPLPLLPSPPWRTEFCCSCTCNRCRNMRSRQISLQSRQLQMSVGCKVVVANPPTFCRMQEGN